MRVPLGAWELPLAVSEFRGVLAVQPDRAGGLGGAAFEPDAHTVAREHRLRGVVGGKDGIETEAEPFAKEREVRMQVATRQEQLGPCRATRSAVRCRPTSRLPDSRTASGLDSSFNATPLAARRTGWSRPL